MLKDVPKSGKGVRRDVHLCARRAPSAARPLREFVWPIPAAKNKQQEATADLKDDFEIISWLSLAISLAYVSLIVKGLLNMPFWTLSSLKIGCKYLQTV